MIRSRPLRLEDDLGFLLSRVSGLVAAQTNQVLAPLDLKVRPYSLLVLACENADGVTQRSVASTLGLDPSQIVALVDELERRDLVERVPDSSDRRNKRILATEKGMALVDDAQSRVIEVHRRLFGELPEGMADGLTAMLRGAIQVF
ncbi:MarR family winged helix-turn-helix transcriptional regulator [Rhodococcus pyridinivorans]|uniref:MarR family winged helix-turn-helix transcriptional regulator n=1 Tax=Rhodococcus pyridinivorans TaxID=103816 RepID=UPI0039B6A61C